MIAGLETCKDKCDSNEECTAIEYASTTWDEETVDEDLLINDCCVLRRCPLPVPSPKVEQAEWEGSSRSFKYIGYAKRKKSFYME